MPTTGEKAQLVREELNNPTTETEWWEYVLAYIYDTRELAESAGGGGLTQAQILARNLGC